MVAGQFDDYRDSLKAVMPTGGRAQAIIKQRESAASFNRQGIRHKGKYFTGQYIVE
jgi:hypothetical protein